MSKEEEFERRLAAVEQAVADLQRRLADSHDPRAGLKKLIGSMADVEGFEEVLRYGREFRDADRPPDEGDGDRQDLARRTPGIGSPEGHASPISYPGSTPDCR